MNRGLYAFVFLTFFWGCASIVEKTTTEKEFSLSGGGLWNITFLEPYQNLPKNGKLSFSENDVWLAKVSLDTPKILTPA